MAKSNRREASRFSIYVVELDPAVMADKRFAAANPGYIEGKPCVYVGMTGLTPEKRLEQHMTGYKAARLVRKYGVRLKPRLYRSHNPLTHEEAREMEVEKARRLKNRGYGVWQN